MTPSERRHNRRYIAQISATMGVYALLLTISLLWLKRSPPPLPWRYAIALLPMLPLAFVPLIVLQSVRRMDELVRRIHLEALALAFPAGLLLATGYGFLQLAGLATANWTWVWPLFGGTWGIGLMVARARYR